MTKIKRNSVKFVASYTLVLFALLLLAQSLFVIIVKDYLLVMLACLPYVIFFVFFFMTTLTVRSIVCGVSENMKLSYIPLALGSFIVILNMWIMTDFYGGVEFILANAFLIREETIGAATSIFPVWTGYFFPVVFASLALHLSGGLSGSKISKIYIIFSIILILGNDLLTFGRVGTTVAILMIFAYLGLKKGPLVFLKPQNLTIAFLMFMMVSLPRLIRGNFDNFENSLDFEFKNGIDPPAIFNSLYSLLSYITQSFFALGYAYELGDYDLMLGYRNFLPAFNAIGRLTGNEYESRIDPFVYIPYAANLYGAGWDFYLDFGWLGIILAPALLGSITAKLILAENRSLRAMGLYCLANYLFWPFYNFFTFGTHFIAFAMLISYWMYTSVRRRMV